MAKKFKNRKKSHTGNNPLTSPDRQSEKPWEVISGGHRGIAGTRAWNSGISGPGKGTW